MENQISINDWLKLNLKNGVLEKYTKIDKFNYVITFNNFNLNYCEKCVQMTNFSDGICQKCK